MLEQVLPKSSEHSGKRRAAEAASADFLGYIAWMSSGNPWPPSGVAIVRRSNRAGRVELPIISEHRVSIHLSAATGTRCFESRERYVRLRGDVDLIPAQERGGFDAEEDSASLELRIPRGFLERVAEEMELGAERAGFATHHMLRDERLTHLAWAINAEQRAGGPGGRLYLDSLGLAFAAQLLAQHAAPTPKQGGLSATQIQRVVDFVEANLEDSLPLSRLARVAGVSSSRLRHGFKVDKGISVHQYVLRRRVERARELLVRRSLAASQVALLTGFAHQSHMARWMRRVLGVSPRELLGRTRLD